MDCQYHYGIIYGWINDVGNDHKIPQIDMENWNVYYEIPLYFFYK